MFLIFALHHNLRWDLTSFNSSTSLAWLAVAHLANIYISASLSISLMMRVSSLLLSSGHADLYSNYLTLICSWLYVVSISPSRLHCIIGPMTWNCAGTKIRSCLQRFWEVCKMCNKSAIKAEGERGAGCCCTAPVSLVLFRGMDLRPFHCPALDFCAWSIHFLEDFA